MPAHTVFACESHPIVIEGLEKVLSACDDLEFAGWALSPADAQDAIREIKPAVVLLDQAAGLKQALQFLPQIRALSISTHPVLWIHEIAEIECFRALQLGARGIARKTLPIAGLLECLRAVASGQVWIEAPVHTRAAGTLTRRNAPRLTPREREIVRFVCRGMKNREIGAALSITPGTVKVHLMHIFEKVGVKDRFELAVHGRKLLSDDFDVVSLTPDSQASG